MTGKELVFSVKDADGIGQWLFEGFKNKGCSGKSRQ